MENKSNCNLTEKKDKDKENDHDTFVLPWLP